jgi:hypothetical protein
LHAFVNVVGHQFEHRVAQPGPGQERERRARAATLSVKRMRPWELDC